VPSADRLGINKSRASSSGASETSQTGPSATASAASCHKDFPYTTRLGIPDKLVVIASHRQRISCRVGLTVGHYLYLRAPRDRKCYPPASQPGGIPGGQSEPCWLSTPAGRFLCSIESRNSNGLIADCSRNGGRKSVHVKAYRY